MKNVRTGMTVDRTPAAVYAYLVDLGNQPEWRFDVSSSELIAGTAGEVGAKYKQRSQQGRKQGDVEVELTTAEPSTAVGFRTLNPGSVTLSGSWRITPTGSGSSIVTEVVLEMGGLFQLIEPLMARSLRRTAAKYHESLRERLERLEG